MAPTDATAAKQERTVDLPIERFSFRYRGWQMHVREVEVPMPLRVLRDASIIHRTLNVGAGSGR